MNRRRLLTGYIRNDASEELDYFTVIPYSDTGGGWVYINVRGGTATLQDGTIHYFYLSYSIDGRGWVSCESAQLKVSELSRVRFKCNMYDVIKNESDVISFIPPRVSPYDNNNDWWLVEGTPLSLLHGDNFKEHKNELTSGYFYQMFANNKACYQINNPKTFLPSTELAPGCYENMFYASSILNAPELPAEVLKEFCYRRMFSNCRSLREAPALNAKTLVEDCYREMFYNCNNLTYCKVTATENLYELAYVFTQYEDFGVAVVSQEIKNSYADNIFMNWSIISEDYPANSEGYPETDIFSEGFPFFLNAGFQQRLYNESEGMYCNYYYSDASEGRVELFELFRSSFDVENETSVSSPFVFFNRRPAYSFYVTDDYVLFFVGGVLRSTYAYVFSDGSINVFEYENFNPDYIKK